MRDRPLPPHSRVRAEDRLQWYLASGPRRCGFSSPPPAQPMLRFSRFRPPAKTSFAHPRDAPGPKPFHARRGTSAEVGIGGIAGPTFPAIVHETAPTIE